MVSRRKFISTGVAGLAGASLLVPQLVRGEGKAKRIKDIGFQILNVKFPGPGTNYSFTLCASGLSRLGC